MARTPSGGHRLPRRADRDVCVRALARGALFPFQLAEPLVALGALADVGIGLPCFIAQATGAGAGQVVAITYEYGNTFVIVAGLLNMLVALDAFDIAKGRK